VTVFAQDGIDSENNDFTDFRAQAFELVRDFEPCLRASNVIMQVDGTQFSALMTSRILFSFIYFVILCICQLSMSLLVGLSLEHTLRF